MSKFAALATMFAFASTAVPAAALSSDLLELSYDLPEDLLAFIAATPPEKDFAVGSGRFAQGQPADGFNISAHGSPLDARGHVKFTSPVLGEIREEVDCLTVNGNIAGVSGPVTNAADPELERFIVGIQDNGEPGGGVSDRAILILSTDPVVAPDCGLGTLLSAAGDVVQGNLVVKDR